MKIIAFSLFFLLPFVSAFEITPALSLVLLSWTLMFPITLSAFSIRKEDFYILMVPVLMCISSIASDTFNDRSMRYIAAFIVCFIVYQKGTIFWWSNYKSAAMMGLCFGCISTSLFIVYEFLSLNFLPAIYWPPPRQAIMTLGATFQGRYARARGFAIEPGHAALYLEFATPFVIYYSKNSRWFVAIVCIITAAVLCTVSSAALVIFTATLLIWSFNPRWSSLFGRSQSIKWLTIAAIATAAAFSFRVVRAAFSSMLLKAVYGSGLVGQRGYSRRYAAVEQGFEVLKEKGWLIGLGPMQLGEHISRDSTLNILFDITVAGGVVAGGFLVVYFVTVVRLVRGFNQSWAPFLLSSIFMMLIHYQIIANFWYPWIWVAVGIVQAEAIGTVMPRRTSPMFSPRAVLNGSSTSL